MTTFRHIRDAEIEQAVDAAARQACEMLDELFPGRDAGGITSDFQQALGGVMKHMLLGRSMLDEMRGRTVTLPVLAVGDAFYGNPFRRGDAFLITKTDEQQRVVALDVHDGGFKPLDAVASAWDTYEAAAHHATGYLKSQVPSIEAAKELGLRVRAVVAMAKASRGYMLVE